MGLRRATRDDLGYLTELVRHREVEPFLAPGGEERLREIFEQGATVGEPFGVFVIENDDGVPVGGLALELVSANSRLCNLRQLMVDPAARGTGAATAAVRRACHRVLVEHGYHRVQTESFGDNHAAHRVFEHVGFVREGVRRLAYRRGDGWVDGVIYGLLAGELT